MAEIGFGFDTWCTSELRPGRYARGAALVIQALFRRATTPRGTLRGGEEESTYGFDVAGYVGAVGVDLAARALPVQLRTEFLKDDRVTDVSISAAVVTDSDDERGLELTCAVQLADETGAYPFTLKVADATVTLLSTSQ